MNKYFRMKFQNTKMLSEDYVSQQQQCKMGQKKDSKFWEIISKPELYP